MKAGFIKADSIHTGIVNVRNGGVTVTNSDIGLNISNAHIGLTATGTYGVYSIGLFMGAYGESSNYYGLFGNSRSGTGVYGTSDSHYGVYGYSYNYIGVNGYSYSDVGGNFYSDKNYGIKAATNSGAYAGVFNGNILVNCIFQVSDKKLKTNINDVNDAMGIIIKLKPKHYEFNKDGQYATLHLPAGRHYGLLAQDLQEVLPNLVKEAPLEMTTPQNNTKPAKLTPDGKITVGLDQKGKTEIINTLSVNYTELIPIIIRGMQELNESKDKKIDDLQNQINAQQLQINELKNIVQSMTKQVGTVSANSAAYIKQNAPNPSKNNTVISYFTPNDTQNAQILISDMKGSVLRTYNVSRGKGQINIRGGELPEGSYNYTLFINNNKIDTKQMIIVK